MKLMHFLDGQRHLAATLYGICDFHPQPADEVDERIERTESGLAYPNAIQIGSDMHTC